MIDENCENCKYWLDDLKDDRRFCKRVPPIYIFKPIEMDTEGEDHLQSFAWSQPSVAWDSWCGEWKEKA